MKNDFDYNIDCFVNEPKTVLEVYNDHHRLGEFGLTHKERITLALVYMHTKEQLKQVISASRQTRLVAPITYPKHLVDVDHNSVVNFIQKCIETDYIVNNEKGLHLGGHSIAFPASAIILEFDIDKIDINPSIRSVKVDYYEKD